MKFWKWSNPVCRTVKEATYTAGYREHCLGGDVLFAHEELSSMRAFDGLCVTVPGGDMCLRAWPIYNALVNHNGNVTVRVDGLTASIASVIAMSR